mmetsp:Transcript_29240/g.73438  ORF Transcript_29240/g.73438 Transcript_29240/m.73438 type:complete len:330 (+) Transcript_29240:181-1170(+)
MMHELRPLSDSSRVVPEPDAVPGAASSEAAPLECQFKTLAAKYLPNGTLLAANAPLGLVRVDQTHGECRQTVLTDSVTATGERIFWAGGLDVAPDGTVYFSDSSDLNIDPAHDPRDRFFDEVVPDGRYVGLMEGKPRGKILKFSPDTGITEALLRDVHHPLGVALAPDASFLLFAEHYKLRIQKLHLTGPLAGQLETFAHLPGPPHGLSRSPSSNTFWVAIPTVNPSIYLALARWPSVRRWLAMLPARYRELGPERGTAVVRLDAEGRVVGSLQARPGKANPVSEVLEWGGAVFLGSPVGENVRVVAVPPLEEIVEKGGVEAGGEKEDL